MATHSSILAWRIPWSLVGYSPWGRKESDTTEQLHFLFFFQETYSLVELKGQKYNRLLQYNVITDIIGINSGY